MNLSAALPPDLSHEAIPRVFIRKLGISDSHLIYVEMTERRIFACKSFVMIANRVNDCERSRFRLVLSFSAEAASFTDPLLLLFAHFTSSLSGSKACCPGTAQENLGCG